MSAYYFSDSVKTQIELSRFFVFPTRIRNYNMRVPMRKRNYYNTRHFDTDVRWLDYWCCFISRARSYSNIFAHKQVVLSRNHDQNFYPIPVIKKNLYSISMIKNQNLHISHAFGMPNSRKPHPSY